MQDDEAAGGCVIGRQPISQILLGGENLLKFYMDSARTVMQPVLQLTRYGFIENSADAHRPQVSWSSAIPENPGAIPATEGFRVTHYFYTFFRYLNI
ncbi:MAG: hypothetical protein ACI4PD_00120 [Butyricicoccus sp.]